MEPVVITVLIKAVSMIFSPYESNVLIVFNQLCSVVLYGLAGESFSLALTQQTNTNSNMYTPCLFRLQDELEPWCVARLLCQTQMNVTGLLYCVFLNNHFYFTKTPKGQVHLSLLTPKQRRVEKIGKLAHQYKRTSPKQPHYWPKHGRSLSQQN